MKRNRQAESSLLLGLSDMVQEDGALAGETASRAAAALAHYPGGDSWMKVLADFAAQGADQQTSWCGIAALILSGDEKNTLLAARKAPISTFRDWSWRRRKPGHAGNILII